jgi:nitroreductase
MIRRMVSLIIPRKITFLIKTFMVYWYDIKIYAKYSNTFYGFDNQNKVKGRLTVLYHIIEKGLIMPETRLGFGTKVIQELTDLCNLYIIKCYKINDQIFIHSIQVLNEYLEFHVLNNFTLDETTIKKIKKVSSATGVDTSSSQLHFFKNEFFKNHDSPFDEFCRSRHSSRNFSKENIPIEIIYQCIELANMSPSDCNRQPTRVYIIKNRQMILEVLELQNGNRGFGHLIGTLLIITSDISLFQVNERNEPFLNSGLFCMSLLYALHFHKIGACLLNWVVTNSNDRKIRTLLQIPENEQIAVLMACGYLPEEFRIACSPRLKVAEIAREII